MKRPLGGEVVGMLLILDGLSFDAIFLIGPRTEIDHPASF